MGEDKGRQCNGEVRNMSPFEVGNGANPCLGEINTCPVCDWPDYMMILASSFSVYRFVSCTELMMPFYLVRAFYPFSFNLLLSGHPVLFLLRDISKIPGRNWLA